MSVRLIFAAVVLAAAPAAAQDRGLQDRFALERSIELQAQQDIQRQQFNAFQNEMQATEGRLRTEQTLREIQAQREPLPIRQAQALSGSVSAPGPANLAGYASIPDTALADSSARVRAASGARP